MKVLYILYLLYRKQSLRINNINRDFLNVLLGFPQESIFGPILFNCFFNEFFTLLKLQMPEVLQTIIH